jgi:thiamine monophosphate kinase
MAGITLATAEARLQLYLDAEAAILARQEYRIGDRVMKFADIAEVRAGVELWDRRVQELSSSSTTGRGRSLTPTPRW